MKWQVIFILFISSCSTLKWHTLDRQTRYINAFIDPLIQQYGTTINPQDTLFRKMDSLVILLDNLTIDLNQFRKPATQRTIQQYLANVNTLILLSKNSNLNAAAFSSTLTEFTRNRAEINRLLSRYRRKMTNK